MSSHRSRISQRLFPEACISGNKATAAFFLWMALHAARAVLSWLDRAEREKPGIVSPLLRTETQSLVRAIELASRGSAETRELETA